jgi:HlyD family secretion protein
MAARGWAMMVSAVLALLVLAACSSGPPSVGSTAIVARATITDQVSSSGAVAASASENVGFAKGGKLTSLKVRVGDRVTAGQVVATVDTFAARQVLKQQKANLAAQEAALDRVIDSPSVSGAQATLSQSRVILTATRRQISAVGTADDSAIHRARAQLRAARRTAAKADDAVDAAQAACKVPGTPPATCAAQVASASSSQASAEQGVEAAKTTLTAAEQKKKVDAAAGQVSVETSRQGVVTAQNALSSASSDRPHAIDQQLALVRGAEVLVRSAQKDVDDGTLAAPTDGVVSAINGVVGEYLSPSSGTTALAPGSRAAIPGSGSAAGGAGAGGAGAGGAGAGGAGAGGAGAGGAGAGAAAIRPGGSQFLVLSRARSFQVVVPFEESDAAQIASGQRVSVSFDAIPGLTEDGTVVALSPSASAISGVISYYVTVGLEGRNSRLRDGQTARVDVTTAERENVLSVPNAAVRRQGDTDIVVVVEPDGQQRIVTIRAGLVGADRTEVVSGLSEGQRVILSSSR